MDTRSDRSTGCKLVDRGALTMGRRGGEGVVLPVVGTLVGWATVRSDHAIHPEQGSTHCQRCRLAGARRCGQRTEMQSSSCLAGVQVSARMSERGTVDDGELCGSGGVICGLRASRAQAARQGSSRRRSNSRVPRDGVRRRDGARDCDEAHAEDVESGSGRARRGRGCGCGGLQQIAPEKGPLFLDC
jgi:hypothetical protein